jgi:transposase
MLQVEDYEDMRRAYFHDGVSIREIAKKFHHGRHVVRKALAEAEPRPYTMETPRSSPVLGPYKERIDELLAESEKQPRKQRYTAHTVFKLLQAEHYPGSEVTVRRYVCQQRRAKKTRQAYLPLEFDPGQDAQVDWGEAVVVMQGERVTVQVFVMRLNHSKARFCMAFPFQKQEAFFEGHIQAFHFFGGVPHRITYDNLKTAVYEILKGHSRREQRAFTAFRSHYLFESYYCTPGQGHEKGGVESDVGFAQRNFLAPMPRVGSYAELNAQLRQACLDNAQRTLRGEEQTVAERWQVEKATLLPLLPSDYKACTTHTVKPNPYSQVVFETNRYSVPTDHMDDALVLRAYPFRIEILAQDDVIASHERCLGREQDVLDPLHYLELLAQRPGAFEHAIPMRRWRAQWPEVYERLLQRLQAAWPDGRGLREFLAILKLHLDHPADQVEQAIRAALELGAVHLDGVELCLRQLATPQEVPAVLDLSRHPQLQHIGSQPVNLRQYDSLLASAGGR